MNCINFPNMFKGNSTLIDKDEREASEICLKLLLSTESGEMFGDPEVGIRKKFYTFNQNNYVLVDVWIDEIFEKIRTFCPQLSVPRNNIQIYQEGTMIKTKIKAFNRVNYTTDTYDIVLFNGEE